jgi:NAD(P)-dependent dehydrogenase (short-subunit alcohol dehydrogenase family)
LNSATQNLAIEYAKDFTDFTTEDFDALISTNLFGFFYITQRTVKEMLKQKSGCVPFVIIETEPFSPAIGRSASAAVMLTNNFGAIDVLVNNAGIFLNKLVRHK